MQAKLVVAAAAIVVCLLGYRQMTAKPVPHATTQAGCTPEAVKGIVDITERAIQSSRCAQRVK
jgi:hypothetical protein